MTVIITEKNNAARRIADILSDGSYEIDESRPAPIYRWDGTVCVGLSGHVVGVDFPEEYSDWNAVDPSALASAEVIKEPTQKGIVDTVKSLVEDASRVVIATDYDREGELIGKEAYEIVREVNESAQIDRVRFSSITAPEVTEAFENPDELDFDLAAAGEARQIIDLIWGAALTRFLSLSAKQYGDDFISVGRVQSPTLKVIVDREREIEEFDPEDYWELYTALQANDSIFEGQYFYHNEDGNEAERVWNEQAATAAQDALQQAKTLDIESVSRRQRTDNPPAPFDTTAFIRAAGSLGYGAQRAMSIAEELYTAGYITYPRTDNTVYPDDLDPEELTGAFTDHEDFGKDAAQLLENAPLTPTSGDEETTDHPPIHPTSELPDKSDLSDDEWEIYELVVRRFFATVAEPATWAHVRVVATTPAPDPSTLPDNSDTIRVKANGKRLIEAGYHAVYPYFSADETHIPPVEEGQQLHIDEVRLEDKQTQPPRRYGQSRLVEKMSDLGIGTKSTRHHTIDKLYDRGYVENNPPQPTQLAKAVVEAAEEFADRIVSEEMTQELEADMDQIAKGEKSLDEVTEQSREILEEIFDALSGSEEEIGELLRESLKADRTVGSCPDCGSDLLIRKSRYGSHFIGCDGYPECEYTLALPETGEPLILDKTCDEHGLHHIKMLAGRNTFVHGCPLCVADEAGEGEHLGDCPKCGEGTLAIKQLESGSRLVGCTEYPDCEYTLPLPRTGKIVITDEFCSKHDLPELVVEGSGEPWELGCPICNYREYQAQESESGSDLEALDGIGPSTAEKFIDAGVSSIDELLEADPEELADSVSGVSADRIQRWQSEA
ncbi:DNA topoisomerase I [Salinarchaeum sp. IM2453]|uniref:DNA topoisomerase I n=1 Tax=Salinarchaeum sp. IM2453 TaxID=2862870 RepID=UPI001C836D2C|nr:DNA topoisomerase I [Salinarchaeum sp. IM2453]QZA89152.1 DNA topoisomerase I [Salinarchaeum sp. IM2453]